MHTPCQGGVVGETAVLRRASPANRTLYSVVAKEGKLWSQEEILVVRFKNYVKAGSLSEAYELNQKKSSIVGGGMMWLKLQNRVKMTLIDLSGLGLDTIEETDEEFRIGCMCTLRMLETHEGLNTYFEGVFKECTRAIVGVQFRNGATVGGSVFGRFLLLCPTDDRIQILPDCLFYKQGLGILGQDAHGSPQPYSGAHYYKKRRQKGCLRGSETVRNGFPTSCLLCGKKRGDMVRIGRSQTLQSGSGGSRGGGRQGGLRCRGGAFSIWRQYERKRRIPEASDGSLRRAADEAAWRGGVERGDRIYFKWKSDVCGDQGRYIPV